MASAQTGPAPPPPLLLLVWLHGFKGDDDTFGTFPERVRFLCSATWPKTRCESLVYPAYDTRGSLVRIRTSPVHARLTKGTATGQSKAVDLFIDYLTIKTAEREAVLAEELKYEGKGDGHREHAYIVLLGHSMGGLVIADAARSVIGSRPTGQPPTTTPLWPHIVGLIGYDTPYYGLNPRVFANTATEYYGHARKAHEVYTSLSAGLGAIGLGAATGGGTKDAKGKKKAIEAPPPPPPTAGSGGGSGGGANATVGGGWWKVGIAAAGVAAAAGAAGAAYWQKDRIAENVGWATSHLDFVGELWKREAMLARVKDVLAADQDVKFFCFYTDIPGLPPNQKDRRQFIIHPRSVHPEALAHFAGNENKRASNEIEAHITMFSESSTGYWSLGDASATLVNDWLATAHRRRLERKAKEAQERARGGEEEDRAGRSGAKGEAAERAKVRMEREIIDLTKDEDAPVKTEHEQAALPPPVPMGEEEDNPWAR